MTHSLAHMTGPRIETERLVLRVPSKDDIGPHAAFHATDASFFVGGPYDDKEAWRAFATIAGHWAVLGYGWFILERRDTGQVIGMAGVHHPPQHEDREIGWMLFGGRGEGLATEAAAAARDWAESVLPPARLVSYIDKDNAASQAVARRLGAETDGTRAAHNADCEIWVHPEGAA